MNFGSRLNARVGKLPRAFPNASSQNLVICLVPPTSSRPFSALMTDGIPNLALWGSEGSVCFPRALFEDHGRGDPKSLFQVGSSETEDGWRHNVTDEMLRRFRGTVSDSEKDDIFFYVYGLLHSQQYRETFAADLKRTLPRIPVVDAADDFWAFSRIGRELSRLHTLYAEVDPWPELQVVAAQGCDIDDTETLRVDKMRYPKHADPTKGDGKNTLTGPRW